jgi:hypothetical protein
LYTASAAVVLSAITRIAALGERSEQMQDETLQRLRAGMELVLISSCVLDQFAPWLRYRRNYLPAPEVVAARPEDGARRDVVAGADRTKW